MMQRKTEDKTSRDAVAGRILEERKKRHLSREKAAAGMQMNPRTLENIEQAHSRLTDDKLDRISRYYHLSPNYILGYPEEPGTLSEKANEIARLADENLNDEEKDKCIFVLESIGEKKIRDK